MKRQILISFTLMILSLNIAQSQNINLGSDNYIFLHSPGDLNWRFGKDGEHNINIFGYGDQNRRFRIINSANNGELFTVNLSSGNVGIGTISPLNGLHIYKNNDSNGGSIRFGHSGTYDAVLSFGWNPSMSNDAFKLSYFPHNSTSNVVDLFTIGTNGNFGIGTPSPAYKLDVIGTIRAREIKVDLNGADFVFEKDYKLMPLNELEKFIKEQKHLPQIVSAKEMRENGTDLGVLNSRLLQKMEEMTLYMIEQNKKIEQQNIEIQALKNEIEKMKK